MLEEIRGKKLESYGITAIYSGFPYFLYEVSEPDFSEKEKELKRMDFFSRAIDEEAKQQLKEDAKEIFIEASLFDLITALSNALNKAPEEVIHEIVTDEYTVEAKIHDILHGLLKRSVLSLSTLFQEARSKWRSLSFFWRFLN